MASIADLQKQALENEVLSTESVFVQGTVTAPAANAAIATIAAGSLPAGLYEVVVIARYSGVAGTADGLDLRRGASVLSLLPVHPVVNGGPINFCVRIRLDGTQALSVNAAVLQAAGVICIAHIVARKVAV